LYGETNNIGQKTNGDRIRGAFFHYNGFLKRSLIAASVLSKEPLGGLGILVASCQTVPKTNSEGLIRANHPKGWDAKPLT
jgi:hypothetical protein